MINKNRANECFWLFTNTLPIGKNQTDILVKNFGANLAPVLPELIDKFSKVCLKYPNEFEGYLDMIKNMIDYITEKTNIDPLEFVNCSEDEKQAYFNQMRIQNAK